MKRDRSDFRSRIELDGYDRFNGIPETALPIDRKNFQTQADNVTSASTSETGIMVALGFIATLLLLSGMQLYRSVNLNPAKANNSNFGRTSAFNAESFSQSRSQKLKSFTDLQITEMSTIQNDISQGKF